MGPVNLKKRLAVSILPLALGCGGASSTPTPQSASSKDLTMTAPSQKAQVVALLRSIETGDAEAVASIDANHYRQHNLAAADGLAGFGALLAALPPGSARVRPVRVFQDGPFVVTHTEYNFFGPKIGFDIFRFAEGKIVEHWDNLQETPAKANPSGHSMIDGPTEPTDLERTEANKSLVNSFVNQILVEGKLDKLPTFIGAENSEYVQHNPAIGDGLSGLGAALREMASRGITMKYTKIHRVLGEGNFVLTVSEGTFANQPTAFYDLFRVAGGKIVEHWDTIETIPPRSAWKNENGKF